jgi:UDP-hydrolysing UDP-N-acetyl-D-glucosamine 2-epimerase
MGYVRLKTIGVITTSRAEYGIVAPILRSIAASTRLQFALIVGGTHLLERYGRTIEAIERDGFPIAARIDMLEEDDSPLGTARSIARAVAGFAAYYERATPDILLVTGDRFEMHAAALAAMPFRIPIAHVHGGEVTQGAIDDALRHGISKMAHLHFTATREYAERLARMGEEPWRITVSGAPSLDNIAGIELLGRDELAALVGVELYPEPLIVTFHPVTLELERMPSKTGALLDALASVQRPIIFTLPNADPGGRELTKAIRAFVDANDRARIVDSLGTRAYFSLMRHAAAMVGNSSSGIIEAASFECPVVNLGLRQAGRTRSQNVIDVASDESADAIREAISTAVDPAFRASLHGLANAYGSGNAAAMITGVLEETRLEPRLLLKRFYDGG